MSKCNACKGKGCDYCDEFDLGMCIPPRKPTRMRRIGWQCGVTLQVYADKEAAVRPIAVYAKVSDVKGKKR